MLLARRRRRVVSRLGKQAVGRRLVLCLRTRPRAVAGPGWLQRAHAYSAIGSPNERRGSPLALPWPSRAQSVPGHELLARVRRIRGGAATRTSRLLDRLQASYCRFCSASRTATVLPSPSGLPTSPPLPTRDIFTCTAPPAAATATAALLVTARSLRTLSVAPSVAASPPLIASAAQRTPSPSRVPSCPRSSLLRRSSIAAFSHRDEPTSTTRCPPLHIHNGIKGACLPRPCRNAC
jgi:hypothetical protein